MMLRVEERKKISKEGKVSLLQKKDVFLLVHFRPL